MVSPGGDLFFSFKTCAARFMCAFGTFRLYAQTAYLRTFLHVLHDCTIKMAFYISTIYNIYPLYIPIKYIFYMYIYKINRAIVRMPYITAFESCSNRAKIVRQIVPSVLIVPIGELLHRSSLDILCKLTKLP